jgi:HK97 family phage prohead protease
MSAEAQIEARLQMIEADWAASRRAIEGEARVVRSIAPTLNSGQRAEAALVIDRVGRIFEKLSRVEDFLSGNSRPRQRQAANRQSITGFLPYWSLSRQLTDKKGPYRELLTPSAFSVSLRRGNPVVLLSEHKGRALASTANGSLRMMEEPEGLRFTAELDTIAWHANGVARQIADDRLGLSFGYIVDQSVEARDDNGDRICAITEATLIDLSPVLYPGYPDAWVTVPGKRSSRNKGSAVMRSAITREICLLIRAKQAGVEVDADELKRRERLARYRKDVEDINRNNRPRADPTGTFRGF